MTIEDEDAVEEEEDSGDTKPVGEDQIGAGIVKEYQAVNVEAEQDGGADEGDAWGDVR